MIEKFLISKTIIFFKNCYNIDIDEQIISIQKTRKEFEGDFTIVIFPFTKYIKKNPEIIGNELAEFLKSEIIEIDKFNIIKGFLNISIKDEFWLNFFTSNLNTENYGFKSINKNENVVVEFSSPNTNKPLHLGHVRNNLLGYSLSRILAANGKNVHKVNLVNDRGIHICKSMLAWIKWGNNETPVNSGLKGDHLIGKYYVLFDQNYKAQIKELKEFGLTDEEAQKQAQLMLEAQELLVKWEAKDTEVINIWKLMNNWVYEGFDITYKNLGIDFDKIYYESETYLLGKELVKEGLESNVFYKKEDGSVWINLTDNGFDEKILLRSDGTSVYITQDIGTAELRHNEYKAEKMIYVVGNEQNYHFDVLKLILKKLNRTWVDSIYHMSYGMVELPSGKMKSREGTVVDADELISEMIDTAKKTTEESGKINDFSIEEANNLYKIIGLGALKYFILKVDPIKNMMFNPQESIDFNGNTGPFIQYTYARIQSVKRKSAEEKSLENKFNISADFKLHNKEKSLLRFIYDFPSVVEQAGKENNPAVIANYCYELAKEYNQFYHELPILKIENETISQFRVVLSVFVGDIIKSSMWMLGIDVPERM